MASNITQTLFSSKFVFIGEHFRPSKLGGSLKIKALVLLSHCTKSHARFVFSNFKNEAVNVIIDFQMKIAWC